MQGGQGGERGQMGIDFQTAVAICATGQVFGRERLEEFRTRLRDELRCHAGLSEVGDHPLTRQRMTDL